MKARLYLLLLLILGQLNSLHAQQFYISTVSTQPLDFKTYYLNSDSCDIISDSTNLPVFTCMNSGKDYRDIALDGTNIWYVTLYGELYSRKINDTNSCKFHGSFESTQVVVTALVADTVGNIYAAGTRGGDTNILYKYSNNTFTRLGLLPKWATPQGDLFFYHNRLFLTCYDYNTYARYIIEVDSIPSNSCYYMPLDTFSASAAFTIRQKEGNDRVFILGTKDGAFVPSFMLEVDMKTKSIKDTICKYPITVSGAASYYPAVWDTSYCPPVSVSDKLLSTNNIISVLNPSTNNIRISTTINNADIEHIYLYDISGRRIKNYYSSSFPHQLDISDIPNGLYVLHIKSIQGTNWKFKVIKH